MDKHVIDLAREQSAQCWCAKSTEQKTMDIALAEEFTRVLSHWIEIAAQNDRNTEYYRGLVIRCGEAIGPEAYTCDDGSVVPDVLCAKVPELIEKLSINQ